MPTTVSDLIHSSMRLIGAIAAGEILETNELNDAFVSFLQMLSSWNTEGASLVARTRTFISAPAGMFTTTLAHPVKIESASFGCSNGIDSPLEIVDSAGWEAIPEKQMLSVYVKKLFCDYAFPTSNIFIWPEPRIGGTLELWLYSTIPPFASLTDVINLAEGYEAGLRWNLALNLAPEYGRPIDPSLPPLAQNFKASLVQLNSGNHMKSQAPALAPATLQ